MADAEYIAKLEREIVALNDTFESIATYGTDSVMDEINAEQVGWSKISRIEHEINLTKHRLAMLEFMRYQEVGVIIPYSGHKVYCTIYNHGTRILESPVDLIDMLMQGYKLESISATPSYDVSFFLYPPEVAAARDSGLYHKYNVTKRDGTPVDGDVFVLRPDRDPHAVTALRAYAQAVESINPELASDLNRMVERYAITDTE